MLPFPILNVYGNTLPLLGYDFGNNSGSLFALDKNTNKLYATSYNAQSAGFTAGTNTSGWKLTLSGVKRIFGSNNNSNNGNIVEMNDGRIMACGSKTPITGEVAAWYTNWEDITSIFTAAGLVGSDIKDISGYYNLKYTVITEDGRVFAMGKNNYSTVSSFGDGSTVDSFGILRQVTGFGAGEKVIKCSGNYYLTDANKLYGTGQNTNYQLGTGNTSSRATLLVMSFNIIDVYSGYQNCYAIDTSNRLFVCGTQYGVTYGNEFGTGGSSSSSSVMRYTVLTNINVPDVQYFSVCVGNMSTHYVNSSGILYSTGNNALAQLGNGTQVPIYTYTNIRSVSSDVVLLRCNVGSLLYSGGKLYYSGRNDCAMGGTTSTFTTTYTEIPNLPFTL